MTQLGEAISVGDFVPDEQHDENTCPWHSKEKSASPAVMEKMAPNEDSNAMPANLGTKLGENLGKKENDEIWLQYKAKKPLEFNVKVKGEKKVKIAQGYAEDSVWEYAFDLQYAPHHLIPGNESLKGSQIVAYLGDDKVIKNFKKNISSKIKDKQSVGYDVNRSENGVWLPSPYALSMSNTWPSVDGIKIVKNKYGDTVANQTVSFKLAYVAAAIEKSGGHQFHMRHVDYSDKVRQVLDKMGRKLKLMAKGKCPEAKKSKDNGKFDAPMGLVARLDGLSRNLKKLLTGKVWRRPMFTDDKLMQEYIKGWKEKAGLKNNLDKVL
ncbi:MAG: AHH domain-containing protein [Gammaproteobacteria bacterium]|nr:AHH domain-containing protein [Gammaproteobacteria bacterium]MDH5652637.1 AHH domain-containing protein [Gammaproteobacteria bacterium]